MNWMQQRMNVQKEKISDKKCKYFWQYRNYGMTASFYESTSFITPTRDFSALKESELHSKVDRSNKSFVSSP